MFHSRTYEHNEIHAQANAALTCVLVSTRSWSGEALPFLAVINRIQTKGSATLLQYLNLSLIHI
eukprot:658771-Prorocentrum_lima.AAC.1